MGKGEIACFEQFLLFPQCFQKACFPGVSKGVIVLEWDKLYALSSNSVLAAGQTKEFVEHLHTHLYAYIQRREGLKYVKVNMLRG